MRKGEIASFACYKQFLLFSQCFPKLYILVCQNAALCGNGLIAAFSPFPTMFKLFQNASFSRVFKSCNFVGN